MEKTPDKILNILIDKDSNLLVNNEPSNFESLESVLKNLNVPENYAIALKFENQSSPELMEKTLLLIKKYDLLHVVKTSKIGDQQEKATPKEVASYNTWAKSINKQMAKAKKTNDVNAYPIVKVKDVKKYKAIYDIMTVEQRKDSEAWPSFPPAPPAPAAPPAPKSKDKNSASQNKNTIQKVEITIKKDKSLELNGKLVSLEDFVDDVKKLNQHLTLEQRREHVFASILVESNDHMSFAKNIQQQLTKADIYNCVVGYNETKRKAGLPIKHFNMNAGLTIEEARKEREKMLEEENNNQSPDKLIDSLNKKGNNKWSYTVETSFVETFDTIEGEMDNLTQTPSTNPSFLEYIIDMEQQGATFYMDGKKITASEAKAIAKTNKGKSTEMITHKDANGKYEVKLSSSEKNKLYARSINLKILGNNSYLIDGNEATKKTFIDVFNQLHQDINPETRNNILNIHVSSADEISNNEVWFIYNSLQDYGFYRIITPNQEINRAKGNTPFAIESSNRN